MATIQVCIFGNKKKQKHYGYNFIRYIRTIIRVIIQVQGLRVLKHLAFVTSLLAWLIRLYELIQART